MIKNYILIKNYKIYVTDTNYKNFIRVLVAIKILNTYTECGKMIRYNRFSYCTREKSKEVQFVSNKIFRYLKFRLEYRIAQKLIISLTEPPQREWSKSKN